MLSEKLCECGCGDRVSLARQTRTNRGQIKDKPVRFIKGHHKHICGAESHSWRGGRTKVNGYWMLHLPAHHKADSGGYVREHVVIAEKALGHELPHKSEVHHVNEMRGDNKNSNLVICEDAAYHRLLHRRKRAVDLGFPATWLKCQFCKSYDAPEHLWINPRGIHGGKFHRECGAKRMRKYNENRRS